ncbi:MAG: hypothetical protein V2I54_08565 [Bacteroidales bacterium]|nr:hypothetical protein [Bacteroidales bacterium]
MEGSVCDLILWNNLKREKNATIPTITWAKNPAQNTPGRPCTREPIHAHGTCKMIIRRMASPPATKTSTIRAPISKALLAISLTLSRCSMIIFLEMSELVPIPIPCDNPLINMITGKVKPIAASRCTPQLTNKTGVCQDKITIPIIPGSMGSLSGEAV